MEGIFAIWHRDVLRYFRNRARFLGSFAMPFMFLILFGNGMSGAIKSMMTSSDAPNMLAQFDFVQFMFPGIIGMTVFTTAIFSSLSVVQDREFGYLREILVSPVSRTSVAIGKILGGTTVAVIQGLLMMIFVPFIGVEINIYILLKLIPAMILVAFALSSIGLTIASFLKTSEGFQAVVQILVFPMLFLSGVFFPLNGMPAWMNFLVKVNPMTYSVDMFKKIVLEAHKMDPMMKQVMGLDLAIYNHTLTIFDEVLLIAIIGFIFVTLASYSFRHSSV